MLRAVIADRRRLQWWGWCSALAALAVWLTGCDGLRELSPDATERVANRVAAVNVGTRPEHAPSWAIAYGREFWRRPSSGVHKSVGTGDASKALPGHVDLGDVIERVSHAIDQPTEQELPRAVTRSYVAVFDGHGLRFSPHRPPDGVSIQRPAPPPRGRSDSQSPDHDFAFVAPHVATAVADPSTELSFRTTHVALGERVLYDGDDRDVPWMILGNTAQALLAPAQGVREHYETRRAGVDVSWIVHERVGAGDLVIEAEIGGLAYDGQTNGGVHFADESGTARVRVGPAVLVDADGQRWPAPIEVDGDVLRWRVSEDALSRAQFPVALDPTIGPEFGMDETAIGNAHELQTKPEIASTGSGYLVVWLDGREGALAIYGARVTIAGAVIDPIGIPISANVFSYRGSPSVASNGTDYIVAWHDSRDGNYNIYASRVIGSTGTVEDPEGILVSPAGNTVHELEPAVASNGVDYLVAWYSNANIYASRVTASTGAVEDRDGIVVCGNGSVSYPTRSELSVASNGTDYLVAWEDRRNSLITESDVYASRVNATTGVVKDPGGLAISTAPNSQSAPSVASNGADYLVAWQDARNSSTSSVDIYAARVDGSTGIVEDGDGILLSNAPYQQDDPAVASNGADYLVAWVDPFDIVAIRVSASTGAVLDNTGIVVSTAETNQEAPAVASDGTDYLVVWEDKRNNTTVSTTELDIYASRVNATTGAVEDPSGIAISTGPSLQEQPSVTSNGSEYFVAWVDDRNVDVTGMDIYGIRLAADGSALDLSGIPISTAPGGQYAPSVASNGTDYLLAWNDLRGGATSLDIYASRVSAMSGVLEDPDGIAVSSGPNAESWPAVASNGSDYLVTWVDDRNESSREDIYASRVNALTGAVEDPGGIAVTTATSRQLDPAVASNGTDYLVTWQDERNLELDIYASRVIASTGAVKDPNGIAVSLGSTNQDSPTVASDGTNYLIAWTDGRPIGTYRNIYAGRVNATTGTVEDPDGIPVTVTPTSEGSPSVACNGTDYFVVWWKHSNIGFGRPIGGSRINAATGAVRDPAGLTLTADSGQLTGDPALAYSADANAYLLAYYGSGNVRGRLVMLEACGNGVVEAGEACDDHAVLDGDGCDSWCSIEPGYTCASSPSSCQDVDECAMANGGCAQTCTNSPGAHACGCAPGYTLNADGLSCDDIDECAMANGGCADTCTNAPGTYACSCPSSAPICPCAPGYASTGLVCDDVDECATANGGCAQTCTNTRGSFGCSCSAGYILGSNERSCDDIDECATTNGGCAQACTNLPGAHACSCDAGYLLATTAYACDDIDECVTGNGGCADTCINTAGSYTCACAPGHYLELDGRSCTDIDECATTNGGCEQTCTNSPGAYACSCTSGYMLDPDGVACADIDECATNNGGCTQACTNSDGAYTCSCGAGYTLDSNRHGCSDIDECATANGGCSIEPGVICSNTSGSFGCGECPPGYTGDGRTCSDIDECAVGLADCNEHATCTNTIAGFTCACEAGYTGDGRTCTALEPMSSADSGCGCRTADPQQASLLVIVVGLLMRRRRRIC